MKFPKSFYKLAIAAMVGVLVAAPAYAATAFFTGSQQQVQTVTYQWVWRCEYNYNGQMIYQLFQTSCPSSIEVQ